MDIYTVATKAITIYNHSTSLDKLCTIYGYTVL